MTQSNFPIRVSLKSQKKAEVIRKYIEFSAPSNRAVSKDATLLRSNLLIPENSKNYKVLLAFRRADRANT